MHGTNISVENWSMIRAFAESAAFALVTWIIADAADKLPAFDINPWSAGAAGFTVWYAWYTTSRVIPRLVQDFRDENRLTREEAAKTREAFRAAISASRERKQ